MISGRPGAAVVLAWLLGAVTVVAAGAGAWLGWLVRAAPAHQLDGPSPAFFAGMLAFAGAGTLVAVWRPGNAVGWTLLSIGLVWEAFGLAGAYRIYALVDRPGLVGGVTAAWAWEVLWVPGVALLPYLFLLFPDGRLPSRRWWPVAALVGASAGLLFVSVALAPGPLPSTPAHPNPAGVTAATELVDPLQSTGGIGVALGSLAAAAAFLVRYRRSRSVERYQLKWFAYAVVLVLAAFLAASVLELTGVAIVDAGDVRLVPLVLLPAATAVAMLRYRLYDVDVVISKSIVYGALVAFIGGVYVVVVVGVGGAIGAGGRPNVPLSLAATALAAVTFQPARERLQQLANRLVYGERANPYEVLASVTARMTGSHPAGHDVPAELARAVGRGVGAATSEVWLRLGTQLRLAASWPDERTDRSVPLPADGETPLRLPGAQRAYPIRRERRLLGAIGVTKPRGERLSAAEDRLLTDLAAVAWLALENLTLIGELRASRQRLVTAGDAERRRVERDLHDGAQQRLLELALTLRLARGDAARCGADGAAATIDAAQSQLHTALSELRELARGLHPAILTARGLGPALESLAERAPLPVTVRADHTRRLPGAVEATAYFVVSEALANVVKHARATSVAVTAGVDGGRLRVTVTDDGIGGADISAPGLGGLADRVAALDGLLDVTSPPDGGTCVVMELPCG